MSHEDSKPHAAEEQPGDRKRTREEDSAPWSNAGSRSRAPEDAVVDVDNIASSSNNVNAGAAAGDDRSPPSANTSSRPAGKSAAGVHQMSDMAPPFSEPRRMKQPTLAVYGMVSDTAALKKEISDRDAQIDELSDRVSHLEAEISRRDSHIDIKETQTRKLVEKLGRFQLVMRDEMRRAAKQGRAESRRVLHQKHFELGQIAMLPGTGKEVWIEGNTMRDLIMQYDSVMKRREEVDALKKAAHLAVKQALRQDRDREESTCGLEAFDALMDAQEELQLRASEYAALTNTATSIKQQQMNLESEKKAFMKEIRRINDEDASEFVAVPTIGENDRYVLMYLLGKGGFSEVWRAFDLVEGQYVACKIHRINRSWPEPTRDHYRRHAERELAIMRHLNHPHLTQLYNVFHMSETLFVSVMEYSQGMDVDTYLKRYRTLKEADARLIIIQVLSALRYLAGLKDPIIHYDLKPANILLHSDDPSILEIKITDFGLSKIIGPTRDGPSDNPSIELTSQGTGTYWYLPPECFDTATTPRISNKVDVWSVGVIFYQMLFGRRPFAEGESQRKIWQEKLIVTSAGKLEFPDDGPKVSEEAKDFISRCLTFNVVDRYDIFQISQHPYVFRQTKRAQKPRSVAPSSMQAAGGVSP